VSRTAKVEPKGMSYLPWTERFKPQTLPEIAGNYSAAEQLLEWAKARIAGKAVKGAALLHGPPGTGKTLAASLVAKALGAELVEMNASDFRTEQLVNEVAGGAALQSSLFGKGGKIIFLDELDGISGREDRGGLGAIVALIRESKYPIIAAVNDPWDPKFRALREACEMIKFRRVARPSVQVQLRKVARLAGISASEEALGKIAEWANGDLRAAINDFQMIAVGKKEVGEGDVGTLYPRLQQKGIFDVMKDVFSAEGCLDAKLAADGADVDIQMLLQWLNENIPVQYQDPAERDFAYTWLSKADVYLSNSSRRQMWDLIPYAVELATGGAAMAKRGAYKFAKYSFPRRISMMGATKEARGIKKELLKEIGRREHVSLRKAASEYFPYIEAMMEGGKGSDLASWVTEG